MDEDPVMTNRAKVLVWAVVVGASLGLHAVAFGGLGRGGWGVDKGGVRKRKPASVEVTMAPRKETPPPPPAAPKPAGHKQRVAVARPAAKAPAAPPPPEAAPPPPAAESPADFTGQTLTNDGPGEGWASATGNGEKMNGPVGRPGAKVTRRVVDGDPSGTGNGPRTVSLADLSSPPKPPPELADKLASFYPSDARARGISGKAVIKARISPEGRVRDMAVISESAPGFGAACEATLRDSEWSPPMDRDGRAVSTFISYTCRFDVE
jgi:TonB family protein